ncbi:MAG: RNA polymerase sigma factor [Actinobacteria bacterium]|nr:RNA polymerase sigma factor [Actinomycetota bacterium]
MAPDRFDHLISGAREGDDAAWSEIWGELSPAVLGYLRGSRSPDPEDVLAETFLQVARDVAGFDGGWDRFRAWVFTIAHHRLIDARRRRSRRPVELMAETPEPPGPPADDASELALARIGDEEVERVLQALSPDQRAVVLLRVIGDLTLEQVAEAMGKRVGAIKQLQRRGLAAVVRELEEKPEEKKITR